MNREPEPLKPLTKYGQAALARAGLPPGVLGGAAPPEGAAPALSLMAQPDPGHPEEPEEPEEPDRPDDEENESDREDEPEPSGGRRLRAITADQVPLRRLRWLWNHRVLLGGLTLMAGREGLGKSTLAVDLAAQVTRGTLAGELHGQPRTVIYVHTEDARDTTVVPRLIASGADLTRVTFLDAVTNVGAEEWDGPVVLPHDLAEMEAEVSRTGAALLVLDAATSVIDSRLDGNKDREMRQALERIAHLGQRSGCAVLGIVHFGKRESADTGRLILGTIAWSQVARSTLAVARDDDTGDLIVTATKANLAAAGTASLRAQLVPATVAIPDDGSASVGRVEWLGETEDDARDLLGEGSEQRTTRDEARRWVTSYMVDHGGQAQAGEALAEARRDGFNERTIQRACKDLGIQSRRVSTGGAGKGAWVWDWPAQGVTPAEP